MNCGAIILSILLGSMLLFHFKHTYPEMVHKAFISTGKQYLGCKNDINGSGCQNRI